MIIRNFSLTGFYEIDEYKTGKLTSENGFDWYESQALFSPEKLKFEFDSEGVITRISMDVSRLWPAERSVADMDLTDVPAGINEKGEWRFDGEKIVAIPVDYVAIAENKKTSRLAYASEKIAILTDSLELRRSKEGDESLLKSWRIYRLNLNDVDTSLAPKIEWPVCPSNILPA